MAKRQSTKFGRFYDLSDRGGPAKAPSVTNIISCLAKPALVTWAANTERALVMDSAASLYMDLLKAKEMSRIAYLTTLESRLGKEKAHKKELEKAGEIGTQVHNLIEWNLRRQMGQVAGPEPKVVDKALWAFMAWEDWKNSVNLEPIMIEQVVWSNKYNYAGTLDLVAVVSGKLTLLDWKTSKRVYRSEAYLQNAAYRKALEEMDWGTPEQGIIVRLPKNEADPGFEVKVVDEYASVDELFEIFLATRRLWDWAYRVEQDEEAEWKKKRKSQSDS